MMRYFVHKHAKTLNRYLHDVVNISINLHTHFSSAKVHLVGHIDL